MIVLSPIEKGPLLNPDQLSNHPAIAFSDDNSKGGAHG